MIHNHLNSNFRSQEGIRNLIVNYIEQDGDSFYDYVAVDEGRRRRRRVRRTSFNVNDIEELWRTPWGLMLQHESLLDTTSHIHDRFIRRFRVSFTMFNYIVQRCRMANMFPKAKIPIEFRLLITFRILARGSCADDIFEMSGIAENTVNFIFHEVTSAFAENFYEEFIKYPSDEDLEVVSRCYEELGFPGACGSMDATHVRLGKCPAAYRVLATGKEGYPTLAFQAICSPNRKILYCSDPYLGSYNDITITANDELCRSIQAGLLDRVKYKVTGTDGIPKWVRGGYLIVDGGYSTASWLMNPFSSGCSADEKRWSEWLESVRKDIECTFGILKCRFRLFDMPLRLHRFEDIHNAWKMACILHNMLITYAGNDLQDWERSLNWAFIDPNYDTVEDNGIEREELTQMNDYFEEEGIRMFTRRARGFGQHVPVAYDTTPDGNEFKGSNIYDYYDKRKLLVDHFNFHYKLGLVKWPRRSGVAVRLCMRIPKVDMRLLERTRYALYVRNSDLLLQGLPQDVDPRIGEGLFSHYGYSKGDVIAEFVGDVMTRAEYDDDAERNAAGGYCVALPRGNVLQCYHARWHGDCISSLANCANNCLNVTTGLSAINNCKITVSNRNVVKLVSNREYIRPHTELLWDYGRDFEYPLPLPLV